MAADEWKAGDRTRHLPTGQHGVVEEIGDGLLRVLWGVDNGVEMRDWVSEEECSWEPGPRRETVETVRGVE